MSTRSVAGRPMRPLRAHGSQLPSRLEANGEGCEAVARRLQSISRTGVSYPNKAPPLLAALSRWAGAAVAGPVAAALRLQHHGRLSTLQQKLRAGAKLGGLGGRRPGLGAAARKDEMEAHSEGGWSRGERDGMGGE